MAFHKIMTDLTHKGFTGSIAASIQDNCLYGKILFVDDVITYEGTTVVEIKEAFIKAVDDYLDYCCRNGQQPNKPYSGTFNVRIGADLHRKAAQAARKSDLTLNEYVTKAIQAAIDSNGNVKIESIYKYLLNANVEASPEVRVAKIEPASSWEPLHASAH
ncbi:MAG: type II toxin-antitoxin system HicB family antitoxin [Burkholderiales bacterium]